MRRTRGTKRARARTSGVVRLGDRHTVEVTRASPTSGADRAILRVLDADRRVGLELEIVVTSAGPTVRVRAQALELEAVGDIAVRCDAFRVEARQAIDLRAGGAATLDAHAVRVGARVGAVVVQANDDVQLLGEQVLLNCDRQPPMPAWVRPEAPQELVPLAATSGDAPLLKILQSEST